jgi:hypothetical protein
VITKFESYPRERPVNDCSFIRSEWADREEISTGSTDSDKVEARPCCPPDSFSGEMACGEAGGRKALCNAASSILEAGVIRGADVSLASFLPVTTIHERRSKPRTIAAYQNGQMRLARCPPCNRSARRLEPLLGGRQPSESIGQCSPSTSRTWTRRLVALDRVNIALPPCASTMRRS